MTRAVIVLREQADRNKAVKWAHGVPSGTVVEFRAPKRTLPQNDRFWAMLTDIAAQKTYHGMRLSAEDWKLVFLDALKSEVRIVPNLDGNGFVNLGRSSSRLTVEEMGDLMEVVSAWGAQNGVTFKDQP